MNKHWNDFVGLVQADFTNEDNELVQRALIQYLATRKDIIPTLIQVLGAGRYMNSELIKDLNLNLSRSTMVLVTNMRKTKKHVDHAVKETREFYKSNKERIRPCFVLWPEDEKQQEPKKTQNESNNSNKWSV
jgi:GTP-binding protein EngB required for normal cell division